MAFIEFLKQNKDKEFKKSDDDQFSVPLYANRKVANLFQHRPRHDSETSEEKLIGCTKSNNTKRNSKSEENIFEKIEAGGASNKRYGTLPKSKLLCSSDEKNIDDGKSCEKVRN